MDVMIKGIDDMMGAIVSVENGFQSSVTGVIFLVIGLLVALVWCFFGFKAQKTIVSVISFIVGLVLGRGRVNVLGLTDSMIWVLPILCGVILCLLGYFIYKVGVFISAFVLGATVTWHLIAAYSQLDTAASFFIALIVGILLAVLCIIFMRPLIILVSSITGGLAFSSLLCSNFLVIRWDTKTAGLTETGIGLVLALVAMIYQFKSTHGKKDG